MFVHNFSDCVILKHVYKSNMTLWLGYTNSEYFWAETVYADYYFFYYFRNNETLMRDFTAASPSYKMSVPDYLNGSTM